LAAAYCERLGIVELVNTLVPSKMNVSPGLVVQSMVLDTLSGRSPLYRLEEFLAEQDIELLAGPGVDAHDFNDTFLKKPNRIDALGMVLVIALVAINGAIPAGAR